MGCDYNVLDKIFSLAEEQPIKKDREDGNEHEYEGFGENVTAFVIFSFQRLIADSLRAQLSLDAPLCVAGIVVVHVKLSGERRGECCGEKQSDREVIDDVQKYKKLKRLYVTNS